MTDLDLAPVVGKQVTLPGHFDEPVILEDARPLGGGYECRVRLPDGSLEEAVISLDEAQELAAASGERSEREARLLNTETPSTYSARQTETLPYGPP